MCSVPAKLMLQRNQYRYIITLQFLLTLAANSLSSSSNCSIGGEYDANIPIYLKINALKMGSKVFYK